MIFKAVLLITLGFLSCVYHDDLLQSFGEVSSYSDATDVDCGVAVVPPASVSELANRCCAVPDTDLNQSRMAVGQHFLQGKHTYTSTTVEAESLNVTEKDSATGSSCGAAASSSCAGAPPSKTQKAHRTRALDDKLDALFTN